jgi:hypothetical protein
VLSDQRDCVPFRWAREAVKSVAVVGDGSGFVAVVVERAQTTDPLKAVFRWRLPCGFVPVYDGDDQRCHSVPFGFAVWVCPVVLEVAAVPAVLAPLEPAPVFSHGQRQTKGHKW